MPRNAKFALLILVVVVVAVVLIVTVAGAQQSSPLDKGLRRTAGSMKVALQRPDARYANTGTFLNGFNLYQHDLQVALLKNMPRLSQPGQFEQVEVWETQTMPPVYRLLRSTKEPLISLNFDTMSQAAKGKDILTTVQQGNLQFRALVTSIPVPKSLAQGGTRAVLEVYKAQE